MANMAKTRLKLSCLPPNIKDDHFQSLFASVGQVVECRVVRDENTGFCVGSGYVEYETEYEAEDAIKMLNGKVVHNKCIKVANLQLTDNAVPSTKLRIENLPTWFTFSTLGLKFSDFGEVLGCHTETDPQTGLPNGIGFVEFGVKEEAIRAKNCLEGTVLKGASMPLAISFVEGQYDEEYNTEENYAGGNNAGGNEQSQFNLSYEGSYFPPEGCGDNSWSGSFGPPTFANGPRFQRPGFQGPQMCQGPGQQMPPNNGNFQGPRWQGPGPQMPPYREHFQGPVPSGFQGPRTQMAPGDFQGPVASPSGYCSPPSQMPSNNRSFPEPVPELYRGQGPRIPYNDFQRPVPPGCQSSRPPKPLNNGPYPGQIPQMCQGPVPPVPPTNCQRPMSSSWQGPQTFPSEGYSSQMPSGPGPGQWMHNSEVENNLVQNEFNKAGSYEFQGQSNNLGPVKNLVPNHRYNPMGSIRNSKNLT